MAITYAITATVTTSVAVGFKRLFHGTLQSSVPSLSHGIDFTKCGGEFWATENVEIAWYHAELAMQQNLFFSGGGGSYAQAIYAFSLPLDLIAEFAEKTPEPWVWEYSHGLKFTPACAEELNKAITNVEVTFEG